VIPLANRGAATPPIEAMSEITRVLNRVRQDGPNAADDLLPLVYQELRKLAAQKMANEAVGHTRQPTALVHDAWLRLGGSEIPSCGCES